MPAGLEVYDASGRPIVRLTDRVGCVVGVINTGTANGSAELPGLLRGTPFYVIQTGPTWQVGSDTTPTVTISGSTCSWAFGPGGTTTPVTIFVGVY
jgi:hypothetical protein